MKQNYYLGTLLFISLNISSNNIPTIPSHNANVLDQTMHNFKTAIHHWRKCLVTHEGCTAEERKLVVEATNVLIERILLEAAYTGATIGEQFVKMKNNKNH